jgi:hypothetical protein
LSKNKPPKGGIRAFRHKIAVLKKSGLVHPFIDARSVVPSPSLKKSIKKFSDVISGRAVAVKATRLKLTTSERKQLNYRVAAPPGATRRIIVPKAAPDERISIKRGRVQFKNPAGVDRIEFPVPFENLPDFFKKAKRKKKEIDRMKREDEYFAFRFFGGRSQLYRNIELLLDEVEKYRTVEQAINNGDPSEQLEVYRNLEVVKVHRQKNWTDLKQAEQKAKQKSQYSPKRHRARQMKLQLEPEKYAQTLADKAKRERERRAKIKSEGGEQYEKMKRAAARRAKRARKVKAAKKKARKKAAKNAKRK